MSAHDPLPSASMDMDPQETREWLDALSGVIETEGRARAHDLLETLLDHHLPLLLRAAGEVSAEWAAWQSRPYVEVTPGAAGDRSAAAG